MTYRLTLHAILVALLLSSQACGSDPDTSGDKNSGNADDDESDDDVQEDDDVGDDDDDDTPPKRDAATSGSKDSGPSKPLDGGTSTMDANMAPSDARVSQSDARVNSDAGETKADASTVDPSRPKPKCVKKDSQVIIIGDSYINWVTHTFPQDIVKESGQMWRMEAIGGQAMATGSAGLIPEQFDNSIKRDPDAHTVVMDGGGNDLLVGDTMRQCRDAKSPTIPYCQKLVSDALAAADKLLQRAKDAGIRDVVYFYYPHVPKNTLLGGPDPNVMLDYSLPMVRDFCEKSEERTGGKLRCYFVDLVPVFAGKPESQWFFPGDIHPTSVGSQAMAKAVWSKMKEHCVGQKTGAGCCEE